MGMTGAGVTSAELLLFATVDVGIETGAASLLGMIADVLPGVIMCGGITDRGAGSWLMSNALETAVEESYREVSVSYG